MFKKWQIAEIMQEEAAKEFYGNPVIGQFLYNRGISNKEEIKKFLNPCYDADFHDPFLFRDMEKAVERIYKALKNGEKITIYGDYDADGVTATVLLEKTLRKLGEAIDSEDGEEKRNYRRDSETRIKNYELRITNGKEGGEENLKSKICNLKSKIDIYIPHRGREGYGLNKEALKYIKENGTGLVITVDCGVSNFEEVEYGKSLGLDIIVTDHHQPPLKLPQAFAIINPKVEDDKYPFRQLAGVGVAFKLAQGLIASSKLKVQSEKLGGNENLKSFEKWLLDLAAVGTIADCCPLVDENRIFAKFGLIVLNKTKNIGLRALIETALAKNGSNGVRCGNGLSVDSKFNTPLPPLPPTRRAGKGGSMDLDAWNVAFQIAPRINAAGRLDHANTAYKLLITEDNDDARKIADSLDKTNSIRQSLTDEAVAEAVDMIEKEQKGQKVFFAYEKKWEPGILGLIAGRICERYYKPVFAFTKIGSEIVASGRSIPEFNMINALREMENRITNQELRIKNGEEGGEEKIPNSKLEIRNWKLGEEGGGNRIKNYELRNLPREMKQAISQGEEIQRLAKEREIGEINGEEDYNLKSKIVNRKSLKRYGGHAQACGLSLSSEEDFLNFKEKFLEIAEMKLKGKDLFPKLKIDREMDISDISWELVNDIKMMEPFGEGNPKPLIKLSNLEILDIRIIGNGGKHLKMRLGDARSKNLELRIKNGEEESLKIRNWKPARPNSGHSGGLEINKRVINAVGFSMNDDQRLWGEKLKRGDIIDIAGYIDVNEWNGNREIQIKLCDLILVKKNDK